MRRRNPVASLLKLRGIREKQSRVALAMANRRVVAASERVRARQHDHERRPRPPAELSPLELRVLQLQGITSHELVMQAAEALAQERASAEAERVRWAASRQELDRAKRLDRRRRDEQAKLAEIAAQRSMDQLAITMREGRACR